MRLTIELEPEQLFTSYLAKYEVEEIYGQILKSYRDETLLWSLIDMTLRTVLKDYREEQEWYVEKQISSSFDDKNDTYSIDPESVIEAENYIRATEKIIEMVKLIRNGDLDRVIEN
jgi:hypothetical protein